MNRNPRPTTPCRPGRIGPSLTQAPTGFAGLPSGFSQPNCIRNIKTMAKSTIPKRGPPPALPKKIDYKKPQMTKTMIQKIKHTQKFQDDLDCKEHERAQAPMIRKPRRSLAPTCGDARIGQERRPISAENRGRSCCNQNRQPPLINIPESNDDHLQTCLSSCTPTNGPSRTNLQSTACPSRTNLQSTACPSRGSSTSHVPSRTRNLAKSMNADIVQAEPLQRGPVDNLIIPPGAINSERTTIVSIPQPEKCEPLTSSTPSPCQSNQTSSKNVQALCCTLDEQDAAESAVVNSKLQDLQQARRDFVMAVASVGGNTISLQEEDFSNIDPISEVTRPHLASPVSSSPRLIHCPSLEDPYLQVEYGRHHPVVESAREYLRSRQRERTNDENFSRVSCQQPVEDIEPDYLEDCGYVASDMNDDDDDCVPAENYTTTPRRSQPYRYDRMEIDRLERFFDLQNYPPSSCSPPQSRPIGPPPGRECLHSDLWELDDPWHKEPSGPDLIDWRSF